MKENIILKKTIAFALHIIDYTEGLQETKKFIISNQLLKSGTSIGANVHEAQNAESKIDFIHKFKIAAKEIEETKYWLTLNQESNHYPNCTELINELHEIDKIITTILSTSKKQQSQQKIITHTMKTN